MVTRRMMRIIMQRIEKMMRFSFMFCHHLHPNCFTTRAQHACERRAGNYILRFKFVEFL